MIYSLYLSQRELTRGGRSFRIHKMNQSFTPGLIGNRSQIQSGWLTTCIHTHIWYHFPSTGLPWIILNTQNSTNDIKLHHSIARLLHIYCTNSPCLMRPNLINSNDTEHYHVFPKTELKCLIPTCTCRWHCTLLKTMKASTEHKNRINMN